MTWQPIETVPKDGRHGVYILIADGVCVPDIARWKPFTPERVISGTKFCAVPEGWFSINMGRSRLDGKATHWMPLPAPPPSEQGRKGEVR